MEVVNLGVHRCHWCGKPIVNEPQSLNVAGDIAILCSDCLTWDIHTKTLQIDLTKWEKIVGKVK